MHPYAGTTEAYRVERAVYDMFSRNSVFSQESKTYTDPGINLHWHHIVIDSTTVEFYNKFVRQIEQTILSPFYKCIK